MMNIRQGLSLGVFVMGAICIMVALNGMQKSHESKKNTSTLAGDHEPVLRQKVGEHDGTFLGLLIGGMTLIIGSSSALLWLRNR